MLNLINIWEWHWTGMEILQNISKQNGKNDDNNEITNMQTNTLAF